MIIIIVNYYFICISIIFIDSDVALINVSRSYIVSIR